MLALSPLLDPRTVDALLDLRARGYDLAVVEVDPEGFIEAPRSVEASLAYRLWRLRRDLLRHRFQELGVAVARRQWNGSLEGALEEVRQFRRSARSALA